MKRIEAYINGELIKSVDYQNYGYSVWEQAESLRVEVKGKNRKSNVEIFVVLPAVKVNATIKALVHQDTIQTILCLRQASMSIPKIAETVGEGVTYVTNVVRRWDYQGRPHVDNTILLKSGLVVPLQQPKQIKNAPTRKETAQISIQRPAAVYDNKNWVEALNEANE